MTEPARVTVSEDGKTLTLSNGLIQRRIRLSPNAATVAFDNLMTGESLIRGIKPEARLKVEGVSFNVGGLTGQPNYAYLMDDWIDSLRREPKAFRFVDHESGQSKPRFAWKRVRPSPDLPWPPPGAALMMRYRLSEDALEALAAEGTSDTDLRRLSHLTVAVHYEIYQGIPLLCKWLTVHNGASEPVRLNSFTSEILALVEYESHVERYSNWNVPNIHVESDYAFGGMNAIVANHTTYWIRDPQYLTQVSYPRENPCLLESRPPVGPDVDIAPGTTFESFRTFELVFDSTERERKGLAIRRMYRTIAPWVTENPLMMHVRRADPNAVRLAIDQCAEVGFEMVILTFGSGFNLENENPDTLAQWKALADYAHSKGVELGGYSLLSSRRIGAQHDVIDEATGKPGGAKFGNAPCLGSTWGQDYFRKLYAFYEKTGFNLLEHDGSYPGDTCASTAHPGHRGQADSQWRQWQTITRFYRWCRSRGIYLNVPDFYYLSGSNKCGMGYRESTWSLPRDQQIIHGRQNIYDGTWTKTPSMGWMFVPLTEYHGGGPAATIEPLSEHLDAYGAHLANNLGAGVQACYRGPRLYDTPATQALVKRWVDFFKRYRDILESDIIHLRRADGRDIDALLHVNSQLKHRGLAMVYNPLDRAVQRSLELPLYYTGITTVVSIREQEGPAQTLKLDRDYSVNVPLQMPPKSVTWFLLEDAGDDPSSSNP
ncbi:MAG: alpha-galactosidase [Planctomycetes bacterium]|nr:alpha-galactosidase [Planctomycetota bacterium]